MNKQFKMIWNIVLALVNVVILMAGIIVVLDTNVQDRWRLPCRGCSRRLKRE